MSAVNANPLSLSLSLLLALAASVAPAPAWAQSRPALQPLPPAPPPLNAEGQPAPVPGLAPLPGTAPAPAPRPRGGGGGGGGGGHDCLVEPSLLVSVGSPVDGVLNEVLADRGDTVRKGQRLAQLQAGVEAAAVDLAEARVQYGRRKVARNEGLYQKQLISAQDKDEMETEARVHEEELKRDRENLKLRSIVSPLDGVVVERKLGGGDLVRADKSIVMKLAQLDPLHVEVVLPSEQYGAVRVGMNGRVNLSPLVSGSHSARVTVVDRVIDAASGTFGVRLQLDNPGYKIPAGIRCSVRFGG
ncbi:efflux RND transporter periplasmic adaptor subunit [Aquabacterium sp. OR-4]|uniref:efflux RND transporter periplasmic adaptor subunit n=1 Tax=Aquabacterium sp. OR-4 TaxID=2978127 RepID=UPI0028C9DFE6|nr:efflux RND transporter periplasmic adaptor subunit [Aquabacterium sp. OR-4]MDT7838820.1 efflux RND transporter periplasmic adaptor subunit [Aquabacterium sp. OR-4]